MIKEEETDDETKAEPENVNDDLAEPKPPEDDTETENTTSPEVEDTDKKDVEPIALEKTGGRWHRLKKLLKSKKFYIPSAIIVVAIAAVIAIPKTRYQIFGLFWSQKYTISVVDSQTSQPITSASISLGGDTAITNSHGDATLNIKVGYHDLAISKKYYANNSANILVPFFVHGAVSYKLIATGRQVPITVLNKVGGQPVPDVSVSASGSVALTNAKGEALLVLPADKSSLSATISANGYNSLATTIHVVTQTTSQNTFSITPAGQIYFMSNLSGKLDLVKTNLDGSGRQTVLAGSGYEDAQSTVLLASRDWEYLALNSIRNSSGNNELNLINTTSDKVTNIDSGNASFTSIGWINHNFIYLVDRNGYSNWQPGATSIKSYNADTGAITALYSTSATGNSNANAQYQSIFNGAVEIVGNQVIFYTTWYDYPGYLSVAGQQNTLNVVNPDGSGAKVVSSVDASSSYFSNMFTYKPNIIAVQVDSNSSNQNTYYEYNSDGSYASTTDPSITNYSPGAAYTTYLLSPSGKQTFWSVPADGQNILYIGDQNGNSSSTIASLSPYSAFGWYTNNYVIVSQGGDELYIMPASGGPALKISDYTKANQNFYGYGSGYGAL